MHIGRTVEHRYMIENHWLQSFSIINIILWLTRIWYSYLTDAETYTRVNIHTAFHWAVAGQAVRISCITQCTSTAVLSCIASLAVAEARQHVYGRGKKTWYTFDLLSLLLDMFIRVLKATLFAGVTYLYIRWYVGVTNSGSDLYDSTQYPVWELSITIMSFLKSVY